MSGSIRADTCSGIAMEESQWHMDTAGNAEIRATAWGMAEYGMIQGPSTYTRNEVSSTVDLIYLA